MKIIIINITKNWVYRLYEEYIISIKKFLEENYKNLFVEIFFYSDDLFDSVIFDNIYLKYYDKIFYTGDLEILKILLDKINYNYNKLYFINVEQMSHPSYYNMIRNIDTNINIIDYSEENIPFFKNIYNKVYLFPPYFKEKKIFNKKNIDIISICNNDYRNKILKDIELNKIFNIFFIDNCYGDIRDKYFSESKIYVNIHCSTEHKTMELIRIVNLIMNKVIIISEKSIFDNLLFINKYILVCNNMKDLNKNINDILTNYNYLFNKIYGDFNKEEYYQFIKENVDKLILEEVIYTS